MSLQILILFFGLMLPLAKADLVPMPSEETPVEAAATPEEASERGPDETVRILPVTPPEETEVSPPEEGDLAIEEPESEGLAPEEPPMQAIEDKSFPRATEPSADRSLDPLVNKLLEEPVMPIRPKPLASVGGRLDASFASGSAVYQGFFIPSYRVDVSGAASEQISYVLAAGQTREFSSVLLPQLMPVEAFVVISSTSVNAPELSQRMQLKLGLFTPTFNPWWSPDLKTLPIPSYHYSHGELFLNRDIGAELQVFTEDKVLEGAIGIFNGTGLIGLNSNNSKALNGNLQVNIPLAAKETFSFGLSGYGLLQSTAGAVNYKNYWVGTVYAMLDFPGLWVSAEYFMGGFIEDTGSSYPSGAAGSFLLNLDRALSLFVRAEYVEGLFGATVSFARQFQIGPVLTIDETLKLFTTYTYLEDKLGRASNTAEIRLRLNI